ncbi:nucleoside-diphosphate-sugar epimerase [gamma proteobacterium HIMB55]|nr:nucleoside-diphosphate-sugar epimerase [gamma proteobacterium HIMB55]
MDKKKVLVTGATGFVGAGVVSEFSDAGYEVVGVSRTETSGHNVIKNISGDTDWSDLLPGVEVIVHCAAAVHQMELCDDVLRSYQSLNVDGTLNLAEQAKTTVKRFIFLSTVKVNGEQSRDGKFSPDDVANPLDPYGRSKQRAEEGLREIGRLSNMEVVVIRPPLVYGPNPKGNLSALAVLVKRRLPIPLGSVNSNLRSLVYLGNLVDFIRLCAEHPSAVNETFLISDDMDLSTADIIDNIADALELRPLLIPAPIPILKLLLSILGKAGYSERLFTNLRVDVTKSKKLLGWKPKFTVGSGFSLSFGNESIESKI